MAKLREEKNCGSVKSSSSSRAPDTLHLLNMEEEKIYKREQQHNANKKMLYGRKNSDAVNDEKCRELRFNYGRSFTSVVWHQSKAERRAPTYLNGSCLPLNGP